jgi:hypothetical protein
LVGWGFIIRLPGLEQTVLIADYHREKLEASEMSVKTLNDHPHKVPHQDPANLGQSFVRSEPFEEPIVLARQTINLGL